MFGIKFSDFKKWLIPQLIISYTFLVSGLVINVFQFINLILVWPFNKSLYRKINYYISYTFWANLTTLGQWWSGSDFDIYATDEDIAMLGHENSICVMNHKYDIDWLLGWLLCQRVGILGGSKVMLKSTLKYIPILGWSFWFSEFLFLKRVWETDNKSMTKDIKEILDYPKDLNFILILMCEGTRYTQEKYEASMEIAKAKGLPILKHHLLPRTKGFTLLLSQVAGKIDYLYDLTLAVENIDGKQPNIKHIKDGVPIKYSYFLRRIPISSIPINDEKKCAEYCHKLYQEKDEIMDVYVKNGDFSKLGLKKHHIQKNKIDLIIHIIWIIIIAIPSIIYSVIFFINGSWIAKLLILSLLLSVNFGIKWMMASSEVKHGSKFGLSPKKE